MQKGLLFLLYYTKAYLTKCVFFVNKSIYNISKCQVHGCDTKWQNNTKNRVKQVLKFI